MKQAQSVSYLLIDSGFLLNLHHLNNLNALIQPMVVDMVLKFTDGRLSMSSTSVDLQRLQHSLKLQAEARKLTIGDLDLQVDIRWKLNCPS